MSHASEDKADVARPLAQALAERGLRVWLDEQELTLGDSLNQRINEGLARSRFGVVILSRQFFAKAWPRRELDGLVARETAEGVKVILPVWHGVTAEEVTAASPTLGARLAASTDRGIQVVADQVERALGVASGSGLTSAADRPPARRDQRHRGVASRTDDCAVVHDGVRELIRNRDEIGLDVTLRDERAVFESAVNAVTDDYIDDHLDETTVRDAGGRLAAAAQRRLASLIPAALYESGGIQRELRRHGRWMSETRLRGGGATWQQAWRFPCWIVGMALGSLLCRLERYEPLGELVAATWINHYNGVESFVGHPGKVGNAVAEVFGPAPPAGRRWTAPAWSWLTNELETYAWLSDRYPEWLGPEQEPVASLVEFDMIDGLAEGFRSGQRVVALWSIEPQAAKAFARRLHGDVALRTEVAAAVGVDLATFDARAPEMLAGALGMGMFPETRDVANILETGSYR